MAVYGADLLWGCPQMNFKANPPFNEMRQDFAAFRKGHNVSGLTFEI